MYRFILRRILLMIPTLFALSIISFIIIQAPPGDFVDSYVARLRAQGDYIEEERIESLRAQYSLDDPMMTRYFRWFGGVLRGNFGVSMNYNQAVTSIILDRLPYSFLITLLSLFLVYLIGIPIGILSAVKQYSAWDYIATTVGFIGLGTPGFLLALLMLWILYSLTGNAAVGLFSTEYLGAPWSWGKIVDLVNHLWLPASIVAFTGTASLIRTMRANLLDELEKPYVMVARAKGLNNLTMLFKYPFRIAINPIVSMIGWTLPQLITGEMLVSLVLGLPTLAPLFLESLRMEDMYLAGGIVFVLTLFTLVGTLVSDILLAVIDIRIREET